MKYLGVDYGTKKTGLALSDDQGMLAFPHAIVPTTELLTTVTKLVQERSITDIVLGHSLDQYGNENPLMGDIRSFAQNIETETGLPIHFVFEQFSSVVARSVPGTFAGKERRRQAHTRTKAHGKQSAATDDKAAAVILQRFLDQRHRATVAG